MYHLLKNTLSYLFLCLFSISLCAQPTQIKPTPLEAVVVLSLVQPDGSPAASITLKAVDIYRGKVYAQGISNAQGVVELLLPIGEKYKIDFGDKARNLVVEVPKQPDLVLPITLTLTPKPDGKGVFVFSYLLNKDKTPLVGQKVILERLNNGEVFEQLTDDQGNAYFRVPFNEQYRISTLTYSCLDEFKAIKQPESSLVNEVLEAYPRTDTTWLACFSPDPAEFEKVIGEEGELFPKIIERNPQWSNPAVVVDATGSMGSYLLLVKKWFIMQNKANYPNLQVFFFTDADRLDNPTVVGKTGNIYQCNNCSVASWDQTLRKAQLASGGGSEDENDVEAVLTAISKVPNAGEILLVADSFSGFYDLELASLINRPIRIIFCGANLGIEPEYLDLARLTGSSIHTIEADFTQLNSLLEGQSIRIGNTSFRLSSGKFVAE